MKAHIAMLKDTIKPLEVEYNRDYSKRWLVTHNKTIVAKHKTAQDAYDWARYYATFYR